MRDGWRDIEKGFEPDLHDCMDGVELLGVE
jgi:hypothetical protein